MLQQRIVEELLVVGEPIKMLLANAAEQI